MEKSMPFRIEYRREPPPNFLFPCNINTSDQDKPDDSSNSNCRNNKRKALSGGRLRFWSEEDEICILEALLEFDEEYGTTNVSDNAFYNRMKVLLRKDFEKRQLRDKIRKLKMRYNKNVVGGCGVEGVVVSHHARVAFDLSDKIWGHGDLAMNADGSVVKVVVGKKNKEDDALGSKEDDVSLELDEFNNENKSEMEELVTPAKEESTFERSDEKQDEDKKDIPTEEDEKENELEKERSNKLTEEPLSSSSYSCMDKKEKKKEKKKMKKHKKKEEEKDNDGNETKQVSSSVSYPFLHEMFGQIEERHGLQGIARIASQNIAPETAMVVEKKLQRIFNARLKLEMKRHDIVHRVFQFVKDLKET